MGGTQTNGSEDKEVDDDEQGLTSKRWHRLYVSGKGGRGLTSIEDWVDASIRGFKECIKKSKERMISAANKHNSSIWTNRKITKKLGNRNGKENNCMDISSIKLAGLHMWRYEHG